MKKNKTVLQILGELVLVAVGVYLGIVSSNWNEQRKQAERQKDFLQTLSLEITANQTKLKQALVYRQKMLATSINLMEQLSKDTLTARFWSVGGFQLLKGWQGVYIPPLENSVYQSGLISNTLAGLDFQTINSIAQVYSYQDEYKLYARGLIMDKIIAMNEQVTTREALNILQPWSDVITTEKVLIKKCQDALKQLKLKEKQ